MSNHLDEFTNAELIEELEARDAMPRVDLGDFSDDEIAEEFERREIELELASVLRFIERELWSPSDWERLHNALAYAVKPRCAA